MNRTEPSTDFAYGANLSVIEPFQVGRSTARLLFDFAIMVAGMRPDLAHLPVLDFGAGSGWITEFVARMGFRVTAFDVSGNLEGCLRRRIEADMRIDASLIDFCHGDGHAMPFASETFGHLLCYDTLHHMHDYPKVFAEFVRVLKPGGRAIFVEPGARHSQSPETIAFLAAHKVHDPSWIERDVVLEEIDAIARAAGMSPLTIRPMPHPDSTDAYDVAQWAAFRAGDRSSRQSHCEHLARINYDERVVFQCDKAQRRPGQ
jgi:SAM-dependent methyltransferase